MKSFKHTQQYEAESWNIADPVIRNDKASREKIRYPLLRKQMGLNYLDTSKMTIWDIGAGALGGVSSILKAKSIKCIDPLADEYKKFYPCTNYVAREAEDLKKELEIPDLIIVTNALDHFKNPVEFLTDLSFFMKSGAYVAMIHAIDNAFSHPHEAHAHNVNPQMIHEYLDHDFEFVWELDFLNDGLTYGWRKQPAHAFLARKVTGY